MDLPLECRRLFLRRWKPTDLEGGLQRPHVNVEIWVRYENSTAKTDELKDVLDYNVMRDALLRAGAPDSWAFVDRALEELMKAPIEAARVELVYGGPSAPWRGSRYASR
jgi:dihydroneopterin aldolase